MFYRLGKLTNKKESEGGGNTTPPLPIERPRVNAE